jgi:RecJ-like exonuclease
MKISVNDQEIFTLSETQKKVIMNDIREDIFEDDMKRRLQYILMHKYEECFKRLKSEWEPKLKENGVDSIPLDPDKFAELVFTQPNYKNRKQRD